MCVPFHALFSPSPREAAPSVSKFIRDTSSGLVWSRGRLHTLFTSASAETRWEVCVCVCVAIYIHCVLKCLLFCDSLPSSVCLHLGLHVCTSHTCEKVCVHTSAHASAAICVCASFCMFAKNVCDIFMLVCYVYAYVCLRSSWHVWMCASLCTYAYV